MTDKVSLVFSIIGTVAFYVIIRFINNRVTGTANELKIKKSIRRIAMIYGILMTIQIISLIIGLLNSYT